MKKAAKRITQSTLGKISIFILIITGVILGLFLALGPNYFDRTAALRVKEAHANPGTRARTVEFFAGQYSGTGAAGQNGAANQTFSSFDFRLAETGVDIKNAFIVLEAQLSGLADDGNTAGFKLALDSCVSSCAPDAWAGTGRSETNQSATILQYADTSGGHYVRVMADVTAEAQLAAYTGGTLLSNQVGYWFDAATTDTSHINSAKAKLVVTYTYDDTSAEITNTVVYPLESSASGDQGSRRALQTHNCTRNSNCPLFNYNMNVAEITNSSTQRIKQWFEIGGGNDNNSDMDIAQNVNIQGTDATTSDFILEAAQIADQSNWTEAWWSGVSGFSENTNQQLEHYYFSTSAARLYLMGGEVSETYFASSAAATKTRTASFPLGVIKNTSSTATFSASTTVYFPETGVDVKKAWVRLRSSVGTDTTMNMTVSTKVGNNATSSDFVYADSPGNQIYNPGIKVIHVVSSTDYTELESATATSGKKVIVSVSTDNVEYWGVSAELMVTYAYTAETNGYLVPIRLFAGQSTSTGAMKSFATSAVVTSVIPETTGTSTVRAAGLLVTFMMSDSDGSMSTVSGVTADANLAAGATPSCSNVYNFENDGIDSFQDFYKGVTAQMNSTDNQSYGVCYTINDPGDTSSGAKMNGVLIYTYQWDAPAAAAPASPNLTQLHYRWYRNANQNTPTSSLALEDTGATGVVSADVVRLRMSVSVTSSQLAAGQAFKLQYQANATSGAWTDVGATGSAVIWRGYDNAGVSDGATLSDTVLTHSGIIESYEEVNNSTGTTYALPAATTTLGRDWVRATSSANWPGSGLHGAVVYDNKMWVMGTVMGSAQDVWYSTNGIAWTLAVDPASWAWRGNFPAVAYDGKMWVLGGDGASLYNDVWYSTNGVAWTQATANAAWAKRGNHASAVYDNKMWVMGGASGTVNYNDVWYSTNGAAWTQATSGANWSARYGPGLIIHDNKMWITGGEAASQLNDVWYSTNGIQWTQATSGAAWARRVEHTVVAYDEKMWVMGGVSSTVMRDVWYSTNGIQWTQATSGAAWGARKASRSVVYNNRLWILGGHDGGTWINDVWYTQGNGTGEWDWVLENNGAAASTNYYFRMVESDGTALDNYNVYPALTTAAGAPAADLTQIHYRWYRNVNQNTPTSSLALEDTAATGVASADIVRLRMSVSVTSSQLSAGQMFKLQYQANATSGSWTDVGATGSAVIWRGYDNAGVSDGANLMDTVLTHSGIIESYEEENNSTGTPNALPFFTTSTLGKDWTRATSGAAWSGRYNMAATVYDNKMWVFDGSNNQRDVWYSTNGIAWTLATGAASWQARDAHAALAFDNKIWVMGGASTTMMNDVWYSTNGIQWTQATSGANWSKRKLAGSVVYDNKMWIFGGEAVGGVYLNDVWYSTNGISWTQATSGAPWDTRVAFPAVSFDGKMWIFGGDSLPDGYKNDVWYSTNGIAWTQATSGANWTARAHPKSVAYDDKIWIFGGRTTGSYKNDVWYSTNGIAWTQATSGAAWAVRTDHEALVYNNRIYVFGGEDGGSRNDVWYTPGDGVGEWDWVLENNGAAASTNYYFRMVKSDDTALDSYARYPQLTTGAAATSFEQSGYRWFANLDSSDVGSPLAATNTAATAPAQGTNFRLRQTLHVGNATLTSSWSDVLDTGNSPSQGNENSIYTIDSNTIFVSEERRAGAAYGLAFLKSVNGGTSWTSTTVDTDPQCCILDTAIFAADSSTIFISYYSSSTQSLRVARSTNGGTIWTTSTVDRQQSGFKSSVVARSSSTAYVSYVNLNGKVRLGRTSNGGTNWTTSTIDNNAVGWDFIYQTSIASPASGTIFVGYTNANSYQATFASSSNGGISFGSTTMPSGETRGVVIDAVDSSNVFALFRDNGSGNVELAKSADGGSSWVVTDVAEGALYSRAPAMRAIGTSTIFVTYYTDDDGLKFAKSVNGGTNWSYGILVSYGQYNDIHAADSSTVYISYDSVDGDALRVAKSTNGGSSAGTFKMQYAQRSGTCDTGFSGETYADLTWTTGTMRFGGNASLGNGPALTANTDDPGHSGHTVVTQTYHESNPFSNTEASIPAGQDGLWDFVLADDSAPASTAYCFRAVKADASSTVLDSYSVIPEITTAAGGTADLTQIHYRWRNDGTDAVQWSTSTIESSGNVGASVSVFGFDSSTLYMSYYYFTGADLKFRKTSNGGGSWTTVVVDSAGTVGENTSISAANTSTVYIAYSRDNGTEHDLLLAKSTDGGSSWATSTVDTGDDAGEETSIYAVDTSTIYISYIDATAGRLYFAKSINGGSNWTTSTVDAGSGSSVGTSLASPASNIIYITYGRDATGDLMLAKSTNGGTVWVTSSIETAGSVGHYSSLKAVDSSTLYVSYLYQTTDDVRFAKSINGGTSWTTSTVDAQYTIQDETSLYAPDANRIFITYEASSSVHYLMSAQSGDGGLTWTTTTVDTADNRFNYNSTYVSGTTVLVGYRFNGTSDLRFATGSAYASWAAAEDTSITDVEKLTLQRLRLEVSNEGGAATSSAFRLEYATSSGASSWTQVGAASAHWVMKDSVHLTDGASTTDNAGLTNAAATFTAGQNKDTGAQTGNIILGADVFTELEYSIAATTTAVDGQTYYFRVTNAGATSTFTYTIYASATIAAAAGTADLTQIHYRWRNDDGVEGNWDAAVIEEGGGVGEFGKFTSIDAPNADTIYISYHDDGPDDLLFAESLDGGNTWATSMIDAVGFTGEYTSLQAMDVNTIYISYERNTDDLGFAKSTNGGTTWTTTTVDSAGNVGDYTSLYAVDSSTIFISYRDYTNTRLKFAMSTSSGATWSLSTVDTGPLDLGTDTSIGATDSSTIYISYRGPDVASTTESLQFARTANKGVTWVTSTLDVLNATDSSIYTSLYAPNASSVYISYHGSNQLASPDLLFARSLDGGITFATSIIDGVGGNNGKYTSIDGIGTSTLFVSYFDEGGNDLKFAKSVNGGTSWTFTTLVDADVGAEENGLHTSIVAVDSSTAYISYYHANPGFGDLKVAKTTQGGSGGGQAASWAAREDTPLTGLAKQTRRRVRFEVSNEGSGSSGSIQYRVEYAQSTAGPWTAVGAPTSATAHWVWSGSSYITDGTSTSNVMAGLTDANTTFVPGYIKDAGNETAGVTLASTDFTELEYSILATSTATAGATYYFRVTNAGATSTFTYAIYASATLQASTATLAANLTQTHYRWRADDGNEASSTYLFASNTPAASLVKNTNYRVRVQVSNEGAGTSTGSAGETWIKTNLGAMENVDRTSIWAADASNVFIAYPGSNRELKFARSADGGTTWVTSTIDSEADNGFYASLHGTDANNLFVAYYASGTYQDLRFAKSVNGGSSWTVTSTVDSAGQVGMYASLKAADASNIFISYCGGGNCFTAGDLMFAYSVNGGSSWATKTIDVAGISGRYTALDAVDANVVVVAYEYNNSNDLRFARSVNGGTIWTTTTVERVDSLGRQNSIRAVDSSTIYISTYDATSPFRLLFAKSVNGGTSWTTTTITDNINDFPTTISAPVSSTIFIGYRMGGSNSFELARSTDNGLNWSTTTIDSQTYSKGKQASIYAISTETAFASYFIDNNTLGFAKSVAGGNRWRLQYATKAASCAAVAASSWTMIPRVAGTQHWQMAPSGQFTDLTTSTNIAEGFANEATTFVSGNMMHSSTQSTAITLPADSFTELEFSILPTANAAGGGTYCFRVINGPLDTYSKYPEGQVIATAASGTLDSATFDTGVASGSQINSIVWQGTLPAGTNPSVRFQIGVSNASSGPWSYKGPSCTTGPTDTYDTTGANTPIAVSRTCHNNYRYFRYRVIIYANEELTGTPRIDDIIVNWSR